MKSKVYVGMAADKIHPGHIHLLKEASKYGEVIVGVLTDKAIASYKRIPLSTYEERKEVVENLRMVSKVVSQTALDYTDNLRKYKPDYLVHGEDWKTGVQKSTRQKAIRVMKEWGGTVIDIPLIETPSSTELIEYQLNQGVTPEYRRKKLRRLLELKSLVRILEAHSGLSGIIVERTKLDGKEFDGIWISSLTDSVSKGKPDIELVDFTSRVQTIEEILEVTTKPIIVDLDTGGQPTHLAYMVKTLERLGVSGIIIEDKKFPKQNSLMKNVKHIQEDIGIFCDKINIGIQSRITKDFMIIARVESLISGKSLDDALNRAKSYIEIGNADGIMIHSKDTSPDKILDFCREYQKFELRKPLIAVPTTYNIISENELEKFGVDIVIYANALLRSSLLAMEKSAECILRHQRFYEANKLCTPLNKIFQITTI